MASNSTIILEKLNPQLMPTLPCVTIGLSTWGLLSVVFPDELSSLPSRSQYQ